MNFRMIHQDRWLVAIDKPAGFHVHPPEDPSFRISRQKNCLFLLRKQIDQMLYPVHRLDPATSGVLLFALESEVARKIQELFQAQAIQKQYYAVTRGWTPASGTIDHPLTSPTGPKPALTQFETIYQTEKPTPVGRYASARYSLVRIFPKTGRQHQIRRHFAHLSHPLIGDTVHGDGKHNRAFRETLRVHALLLKAHSLKFIHPMTGEPLFLRSRFGDTWHRVFNFFGCCPFQ